MRTKKDGWSQLWKRNAVVAAIALFVCAAVYLNWNYDKEADTGAGKTLGQSAMVGGQTQDPLVSGDRSAAGTGYALSPLESAEPAFREKPREVRKPRSRADYRLRAA